MGNEYLYYIKEKKYDRSEQTRKSKLQWDGITDVLTFHLGFVKICKNIFLGQKVKKPSLLATDEHQKILTKNL